MNQVKLMVLEPGHFHAGLVHKNRYPQVDETVYVYAQQGLELDAYRSLINRYNTRVQDPTQWNLKEYSGPDYLEKMLHEKPGNVVVLSGNNARKTDYIKKAVDAGIHVLADKPMVIHPEKFDQLLVAFETAKKNGVLLYDIMTERYEITTMLQKELSKDSGLFGEMRSGSPEDPSITKESVHHFFKYVSGSPLQRPAWFFDVQQQGEGIVDVSTHLVDLVLWECFPEQGIDYQKDIEVIQGKRSATDLSLSQFERVTGLSVFPDYFKQHVKDDSILQVFSNGEIIFKVRDIFAKTSVIWNYEAPAGGGDTHYSIMKGTQANLIIRQDKAQDYVPTLFVEPLIDRETAKLALDSVLQKIHRAYPGISYEDSEHGWQMLIPDKYKIGHEAHFAQVTKAFLRYLEVGALPDWEVPNMIAKYYVTCEGFRKSR